VDASEIKSDDVVYFLATSVDGYIADKNGDDSFLHPYYIPELNFHGFIDRIGTIIMGRRTWDKIERGGKWPYGKLPGIVATHRPIGDIGAPVTCAAGSAGDVLAAARSKGPGAYWLVGGADLATQFLLENLLTRIDLFTMPVLTGGGIPAFRTQMPVVLDLVSSGTYPKSITRNT